MKPDQSSEIKQFHRRSVIWIGLAAIVIILSGVLPVWIWENWYYKGLFPLFRVIYDYTLGWFPIPMAYVVVLIISIRTVFWLRQRKKGGWFQLSRALGGIAALITLFYLLWGFNYGQVSFHQRIGLQTISMTEQEMKEAFDLATKVLLKEATALPVSLTMEDAIKSFKTSDHHIRQDVKSALETLELPHTGRVRIRQLWPNGFLMRWSTAGIYIPQTGEGHIDRGLLSVQKPYTMAHEMAHGYGVTDEGACNFIAWLACMQSDDPWTRFSGALSYWRSAASNMPDTLVIAALNLLPPVVPLAIDLVRKNNAKYPDLLPAVRNAIYASYLKRHGIKSGLRSYNEVVVMVHHYLKTHSVERTNE